MAKGGSSGAATNARVSNPKIKVKTTRVSVSGYGVRGTGKTKGVNAAPAGYPTKGRNVVLAGGKKRK